MGLLTIIISINRILFTNLEHQVKHVYRYEGNSDPGDSAIVYGITSSDGKGGFVAGFSAKQIMKLFCIV
jgi:hypothetical protein